MEAKEARMQLTPTIAIHMSAALGALAIGPIALWARRGREQRPRLHRALGYAWVTLMVIAAGSAMFIRDTHLPNIAGFTPIHLLVPLTFGSLFASFRALARRHIALHRRIMQNLYVAACVAGAFTLLPSRLLGHLVIEQWLGLDVPTRGRLAAMAGQIVSHTPVFVWGLLAVLIGVGLMQARERRASMTRATVLPALMVALSLWSTASLFASGAHLALAVTSWLVMASLAFGPVAIGQPPRGTRFDAATATFLLPGSWAPMLLIVCVFAVRYAANVTLAIDPAMASDASFVAAVAAISGAFTGAFGGRAARLWQLARRHPSSVLATTSIA
jgi:uncharacterized membrane protein